MEADGGWITHQWIKKAVLLSFRLSDNVIMKAGDLGFYDKVQTKFAHLSEEEIEQVSDDAVRDVRYLDVLPLPDGGYRIWYEARLPDESHELRTERTGG